MKLAASAPTVNPLNAETKPAIGYAYRPLIYITSGAKADLPGHRGPGRDLSIMSQRNRGTLPRVPAARIDDAARFLLHSRQIEIVKFKERYCALMEGRVARGSCAPGTLSRISPPDWTPEPVNAGDTLICSCAARSDDECHRFWLAPYLLAAGWRVVLDGKDLL